MSGPPVPMLPSTGTAPSGAEWAWEFKWDGMRLLCSVEDGRLVLYSRTGGDYTANFPELSGLGNVVDDGLLDGEVIALDAQGRPSFARLAKRFGARGRAQAHLLAPLIPATYMIFDVLRWDRTDYTSLALAERRKLLESLNLGGPAWMVPPVMDNGPAALAAAVDNGLEGVVAKRWTSPYRPGRTRDWIKVKRITTTDVVIGGWRNDARSLLVGEPAGESTLRFRGRVGSGITIEDQTELLRLLRPLTADEPRFTTQIPVADAQGATWVLPRVVIEVAYLDPTEAGRLRHPRFIRIRPDKTADDL